MTKTPVIIKDAYREGNLIAETATLTEVQSAEGLKLLNRIIAGVYGYEVGDPLYDWPVGTDGAISNSSWSATQWPYLTSNMRIVTAHTTPQTIYLPPEPDDGARIGIVDPGDRLAGAPITLSGNGRDIEGAASILLNEDNLTRLWFYRADKGEWVRLNELAGTADEEFPFPQEFDDLFITRLAMRLNPRYGRAMAEATVVAMEQVTRKLRARYQQKQIVAADLGVLHLTGSHPRRISGGRMSWMN